MALIICGLLLLFAYSLLIGFYGRGWRHAAGGAAASPERGRDTPLRTGKPAVTVLIPARNEAANLPALLNALRAQTYPRELFEVLVLDDHSTDETGAIARHAGAGVKLLSLPPGMQGKKAAIAYGVGQARGAWIVTTDADCLPGPGWLSSLAELSGRSEFIAAPVRYRNTRGLCAVFQTLDFMTLQGITAASVATNFHSMCNGANLAYTKAAFEAVDGFAGVDGVASGDDLLLMHKIAVRFPGRVQYRMDKSAIVDTDPAPGWAAFWKQRIRWASKSAYYQDWKIKAALLLIYFLNLYFIVLGIACFFDRSRFPFLLLLACKTIVELLFLRPVARFFGQRRLLWWFPLMQPIHIMYTVLVGTFSQFGTYEWKGRRVR